MSRIKSHKLYSNRSKTDYAALSLKSIGLSANGMQIEFTSHSEAGEPERLVTVWLDKETAAQMIKRVRIGEKQGHCRVLYNRAEELQAESNGMNIPPIERPDTTAPASTGE